MDTNSNQTSTLNPITSEVVTHVFDTIVNAISNAVMEKVAARIKHLEESTVNDVASLFSRVKYLEDQSSAEPGADYVTLATRIATIEASVKEAGEKLDEIEGTLDEHQSTLDDLPSASDIVTDDRITDAVSDALGEQLPDALNDAMGDYVKADDVADAINDNLPDDVVRRGNVDDFIGTAISKLRIVVGD